MRKFPSVRNLFAGAAPIVVLDEDEDEDVAAGGAPTPPAAPKKAGPSASQVEKVVSDEVSAAVTAERARCVAVISSDAGAANPKAAAKLLGMAGGSGTADEIIASLEEMAPVTAGKAPPAPPVDDKGNGQQARQHQRQKLAADPNADPDTGGAGNRPADRRGEGSTVSAEARQAERAARAEKRNAKVKGGVKAGA